jgi:peptidoglycan/xylan/chitin deacetylase (PgdA/CDA1 family)
VKTTVMAVPPQRVPILMYHEIAQRPETTSSLAVPPQAWAAQLAYLSAGGYRTITAAELAAALAAGGELPSRTVVLTFDDGFADFHGRAMPLLARYGFTATVFVTTGWVQDSGPLPAGQRPGRMLSWGQVEEAASAGIEVAAHSCLHPQLDQLPAKRLREELHASRARLEDRLGVAVPGVAYPFGYSNQRVRNVARDLGYAYGCAVGNAMAASDSDLFTLPRLTIRRATAMAKFQEAVQGRHVPRNYLKERALTKGWAVVRRGRAALASVSRGDLPG